uniref:hypothetical protein n=1 Tax=Bacteroides propionicifaciens TaxID=392838 RepID=UPI00058BEC86
TKKKNYIYVFGATPVLLIAFLKLNSLRSNSNFINALISTSATLLRHMMDIGDLWCHGYWALPSAVDVRFAFFCSAVRVSFFTYCNSTLSIIHTAVVVARPKDGLIS